MQPGQAPVQRHNTPVEPTSSLRGSRASGFRRLTPHVLQFLQNGFLQTDKEG